MHRRVVRFTLLALLVASGLAAAYFLRDIERRINDRIDAEEAVATRLARMNDAIAGIGAAQQSYVAPGQLDAPWFDRVSALVEQLSGDIARVRASLRSRSALDALQELSASTDALIAADMRTRQNLRLGQDLMAADVIFSDARNILDAMIARLRELRDAEQAFDRADRAALSRERWLVLAVTASFWLFGLLALVTIPDVNISAAVDERPGTAADVSIAPPAIPQPSVQQRGSIDLLSAASLCSDLSRMSSTEALPALLGRAAGILDASGVVLWMSAGEQLFPVMGHGYRPEVFARLGPIARAAENAAAAAWRTGHLTIVGAGGPATNGAVVAPMFGLHDCIGVLAAEVRHGGEYDPATQAVATMIAAQLATVVPAWPAGSLTQPVAATAPPDVASESAPTAGPEAARASRSA